MTRAIHPRSEKLCRILDAHTRSDRSHFVSAIRYRYQYGVLALLIVALLTGADSPASALKKVRQGLTLFRAQKFAEAETAFSEAEQLDSENATIRYDLACAALAAGHVDRARGLLISVSRTKDPVIAKQALYNLGCLETGQAKELLGEDPVAVAADSRDQIVAHLQDAVRHYRNVLRIDRSHQAARHNLELVRVYLKHIQSQWAEHDRQKARDEKNLLQFLKMIEQQQSQLRTGTQQLLQQDDSVQRRRAFADTEDAQRQLQEEIGPLQAKIQQEFQAAATQSGAASNPSGNGSEDQAAQAEQLLLKIAEQAGDHMLQAAEQLAAKKSEAAATAQAEALDQLNQIYMAVSPYQDLLQRALAEQEQLVPAGDNVPETGGQSDAEGRSASEEAEDENDANGTDEDRNASTDEVVEGTRVSDDAFARESERQRRISQWTRILPLKAEQSLPQQRQQLESLEQQLGNSPPTQVIPLNPSPPADDSAPHPDSDQDAAEAGDEQDPAAKQREQLQTQAEQIRGLIDSMERAVRLGPDAESRSRAAEAALNGQDAVAADSEQAETLRILREIAEPLKHDDNKDQNQDEQNDDQQNDENEDKDQGSKDQQKNEPRQDDQQQESDPQQQQQDQQQRQQQAESTLRKAREREQEQRERDKKLRALLQRAFSVDKDW